MGVVDFKENDILENNILEFINTHKIKKNLKLIDIYTIFCICTKKIIIKLYNKLNGDLSALNKNKNNIIITGLDIFYNIFFILINYTNNIKVTLFLIQRAIILYIEFITISNERILAKDFFYNPKLSDAIIFVYKKTLGGLNISSLKKCNNNLYIVKIISKLMLKLLHNSYIYNNSLEDNNIILDDIINNFKDLLYKIFNNKNINSEISLINLINYNLISFINNDEYFYSETKYNYYDRLYILKIITNHLLLIIKKYSIKNKSNFNDIFDEYENILLKYKYNIPNYNNFNLLCNNYKKNKLYINLLQKYI